MPLSALRIIENLELYYKKKYQNREDVKVFDVNSLSKGWQTELYSFKLAYKEDNKNKKEDLILRIFPSKYANIQCKREFYALIALYNAGYTVPKTHLLELDESIFGKPFIIMDRIIGVDMGEEFTKAVIEEDVNKILNEILPRLSKSFAELHKLDWNIIPNELESVEDINPYYCIDRSLTASEKSINEYNFQELIPILKWLKNNRDSVPFDEISVLHYDFHPHNIIISNDNGKNYIVDWAGCRVGDFRVDLSWTLMLMRAFVSPGISEALMNMYETERGIKVKNIEYFEVLSILRRFFDVLIALTMEAGESGYRDEASQQIKQTKYHLDNIYNRLIEITDVKIPELKKLLTELTKI